MSERSATPAERSSHPDMSSRLVAYRDLPTAENAPVLEALQTLGVERFREQFAEPTPLDRRGFVDYHELLEMVAEKVGAEYKWPNTHYDIHHLQWTAAMYKPSANQGSLIPQEFREIPFHKLYIPRQLHDFIHIVTLPPERPSFYAMWNRVKAYRRAEHLFSAALNSIHLEVAEEVARPLGDGTVLIPRSHEFTNDWHRTAKTSRAIESEVLVDRYAEFTRIFEKQLAAISIHDLDGLVDLSHTLPVREVVNIMQNILPSVRKKRASLRPHIPVDNLQITPTISAA